MTVDRSLGMWLDCSPNRVTKPGYLEEIAGLGVGTVAIMGQEPSGTWTWTPHQVAVACQMARGLELEVVLTTWPQSHVRWDLWAAEVDSRLEGGCVGLEVDLEGQWRGDLAARASLQLVDTLAELSQAHDVRVEVTTFPSHPEAGVAARVSPHADRLNLQIYSVRHRPGGQLVDAASRLGPGRYQREALDALARVPWVAAGGGPRVGVGLAVYGQDWPGIDPCEAVRAASAAVDGRAVERRLWSSKWVVGGRATAWARAAVRAIR